MRAVWESGNDVTDVDVAKTAQQPTVVNLSAPTEIETPPELRIFERPELDTFVAAYAASGGSDRRIGPDVFRPSKRNCYSDSGWPTNTASLGGSTTRTSRPVSSLEYW